MIDVLRSVFDMKPQGCERKLLQHRFQHRRPAQPLVRTVHIRQKRDVPGGVPHPEAVTWYGTALTTPWSRNGRINRVICDTLIPVTFSR
jgi:hypothetical protein